MIGILETALIQGVNWKSECQLAISTPMYS
jgi:hypothetical protein